MKLLALTTDYNDTIQMSKNLKGNYHDSVIFHCYWNGNLNEKHFYSILSCYYFNVFNNKHQIVLWLENNTPNHYNKNIARFVSSLLKKKKTTQPLFLKSSFTTKSFHIIVTTKKKEKSY